MRTSMCAVFHVIGAIGARDELRSEKRDYF